MILSSLNVMVRSRHGIRILPSYRKRPSCYFSDYAVNERWRNSRSNDERSHFVKYISTTPTTAKSASPISSKGGTLYQQALKLMKQSKDVEETREQERSQKMYEAWKKTQEKVKNKKSIGVKVIKTLVKETRKDQKNNMNPNDTKIEVIRLLKRAAYDYNHPEAAVQLGNMLLNEASRSINNKVNVDNSNDQQQSESSPKNLATQAMDLFRQAGEAGSRAGWYNLGHLWWIGFPDEGRREEDKATQTVVADTDKAMDAFQRAIDLGDSDAMYLVGVHNLAQSDPENCKRGIKLIEQASDDGHGGALYYLALLNLNGEPIINLEPCSLEEFVDKLDRAVQAGDVDARFVRGNSYYSGTTGYSQDFKKALHDFLQAADEGHAESAVSAGAMLHNGVGVLKDQRRAFELYQLAGELGSEEGWMNVVDCWQHGLGVPKSNETARYIKEIILKKKE